MTRAGAPRPLLKGPTEKRVMAIVPGGFDEDASDMGIASFRDRAAGLLRATGVLGRHESDEAHEARGGGKAARVAEFGGDGQRGEIVDTAEAAQAFDTGFGRIEREQVPQVRVDRGRGWRGAW